jgi:aminoglycoside/choline kinase family phosphotransferase
VLDVAGAAAALCDADVGTAFARYRERLGLAGGQRELALYGQTDQRWRQNTPKVYGTGCDAERRLGWVVLEDLSAGLWMDPCEAAGVWRPGQIEAAIRGLAELHTIWFERQAELSAQPWLGPVFTAASMAEMTELWTALASHAARTFVAWLGPDVRRVQRRLLARLERWWRPLEQLPHTLVHNDFNPRNLALRDTADGWRLCAYDWELATSAVPQHDLAQFLCFVLPADCSRSTVRHYLDLHRETLEAATGRRLAADDWQRGFALALGDLLLNRWAMLALVHAVRRQPFLKRVLHTWRTLYADFDPLG